MSTVLEYKCPNCGGAISFDPNSQQMKCPYCEAQFDVANVKDYSDTVANETKGDKINWDAYDETSGSGNWRSDETSNMLSYVCESCGGEIVGDESMGASSCPYCGNPVIIARQFSGMLRPDLVIPFKLDKEAAKAAFKKFTEKKILLPNLFRTKSHLDSIKGIYVPYWLYNCKTDVNARFNATKVTHWSDSKYNYTRTDHYMVIRQGNVDFELVPVDGSSKLDNNYTEAVEPFDYSQAVDFETAYLSGYLADKYDVNAEQSSERANERIKQSATKSLQDTVMGYTSCTPASVNIAMDHGNISYALLPLWLLNAKYNGKLYTFVMNGQTGKFVGTLPMDKTKFWLWFSGVFAGCGALFSALAYWLF